jgi:predicted RNA-binding Zn-ribbon protein involved in translation (DUF1610 family)
MLSLIFSAIVLIGLPILVRILRDKYEWMDYILYIMVPVVFISTWISENFWWALLATFIYMAILYYFFGIGNGTILRKYGKKHAFTCPHCGYEEFDILDQYGKEVTARCQRCGETTIFRLNV